MVSKNMEVFDINPNIVIKKEIVEGSPIYIIDNFYHDVDRVLDLFLTIDPQIHKEDQKPSYNQIHFDDRRHNFLSQKVIKVYKFLSKVCNQECCIREDLVITNFTRFKSKEFNDYQSNYWWPHIDAGYNGILYLNKSDTTCGTNLYHHLNPYKDMSVESEHYAPWRDKNDYKLIKSIQPKYNRMVLFNGFKFHHGMNICDDQYFGDTYRMNQVFFLRSY